MKTIALLTFIAVYALLLLLPKYRAVSALSAAALGVILGVDLILLGIEAVVFAIDCYCRLK